MKLRAFALFTALVLILVACSGSASVSEGTSENSQKTTEEEKVLPVAGIDAENYPYIDGSTACHPLLARIYREICGISEDESESMVAFDLGSTGSIWQHMMGSGIYHKYIADLIIAYEPPEDVKTGYAEELRTLEIDPLGRDALVFMVNADNPVDNLTTEQLYDIYTGKITDWSEVGGEAREIRPFQRNGSSGSQALFMKLLMHGDEPMEAPTELVSATMNGLIDSVAQFDGSDSSIGYSVYYYASLMHTNENLKLLSVNGIAPTNESIADGSYPLWNDFYVVIHTDEPQDSPVRALRDWLLTDAGRKILEEENYVWSREGMETVSAGAGNPFAVR